MDIQKLIKNPEELKQPERWNEFEKGVKKLLEENNPLLKEIIPEVYPHADKKGKKFLKKVAHLLKTRGISVEIPEEKRESIWRAPEIEKKILCASFDSTGTMVIAFSYRRGNNFSFFMAGVNYRKGIVSVDSDDFLKEDPLPVLRREWEKTNFFTYEMPYEHGLYHLKKAILKGNKKTLPYFITLEEINGINYNPSDQIGLGPLPYYGNRKWNEILWEIHPALPFAALLPEEEMLPYIEEYLKITDSPIILPPRVEREKKEELYRKIIEDFFKGFEEAYSDFFLECGIIAMKKGNFDSARIMKGWALSFTDNSIPLHENPLVTDIIVTSLEYYINEEK